MGETLPANAQSSVENLPEVWVEKLFNIMEDRYGSMWADRYGAFPRSRVMLTWGRDLSDMSREELARGVELCRDRRFPPTLPEFRELCRPALDYERAFIEAVEQMRLRDEGRDQWSSPVVFWAAVSMGVDLKNNHYGAISKRWSSAVDVARDKIKRGELPDVIPKRLETLPAPGRSVTPECAAENIERMKAILKESNKPFFALAVEDVIEHQQKETT